jgi:PAS domain S-box-containing protein
MSTSSTLSDGRGLTAGSADAADISARAILEGAGVGIAVITLDGRLVMSNAAFCDLLGYTEAELEKLTPNDVTHPDDAAADFNLFQELLAGTRQRYTIEKRYIRKDGVTIWTRLHVALVRQAAGDYAVAVIEDITERRNAEELIRESEERFRVLTERISEVFYVADADPPRVLYVSTAYESVWQRKREQLYADALSFVDGIAEQDRPRVAEALERQQRGEETEIEYRVFRPDGTMRWVRDRAYPVMRNGRVYRVVGLASDITEARQAAEELRRANDRYELAARATNDVIWDWDPVRGSIIWSEALQTLFGYDRDAIDDRLAWWDQRIHPEDRDRVIAKITRAVESDATYWSDEYRFLRADGGWAEVLDRAYMSRDASGSLVRMIGAMLDVTERKRAERIAIIMAEASAVLACSLDYHSTLGRVAQLVVPVLADACTFDLDDHTRTVAFTTSTSISVPLRVGDAMPMGTLNLAMRESRRTFRESDLHVAEDLARRAAFAIEHARLYHEAREANRAKDEFLATLSHEMRTPLTAIVGWAAMLKDRELDAETQRLGLETIHASAQAQTRLIDDVLDVSRVVSGKLYLQVQPVTIEDIVRRSVDAVRLAASAKNIELRVPESRNGIVIGDPDRLQQVIWNLLTNAIKFTPAGGRVIADVVTSEDHVQLIVTDTGQGIAPEFLPHVFEPFRQGESTSIRTYGGLGLGLAIVRYITEAHGGRTFASSEGLGRGATFVVELPRAVIR